MANTVAAHYVQMFTDGVQQLAGSQSRSLLKEFIGHEAKAGEVVYLDGIGPDDDASTTAIASTKTRRRYEDISTPDFDDWYDLQTPHDEISRQRTLCTPSVIDWGYHFSSEQEMQEKLDPQGLTLRQGMRRVFKAEDALILAAFAAGFTQTGNGPLRADHLDDSAGSNVDLDSGQTLTIDESAGGTALDSFAIENIADILEIFEGNYVLDEPIYLVMSPRQKKNLINNSGGTIHSKDFVDARGYFSRGELPDIYGVHCLVHPALTKAVDADEYMYAWTPYAATWNQFKPLATNLGVSPEQRFHTVAYLEQHAGCVRVDDLRFVGITIDRTA